MITLPTQAPRPSIYYRLTESVILVTQRGRHFVSESGVAALETMLRTVGLNPFLRVCRQRSGPERATFTRWQWDYLGEFLGWEWHRAP